jgi:hypothetical protein
MALYFFNDIFLLHFSFKAPKCILYAFAFLQPNFSHPITPPICGRLANMTQSFYFKSVSTVKEKLACVLELNTKGFQRTKPVNANNLSQERSL